VSGSIRPVHTFADNDTDNIQIVRIANGEWKPYTSEKLKHFGYISHIVSEAFLIEGVKVEYSFFPWARSLHMVKTGDYDCSIGWSKNIEREKYAYFSLPILEVNYSFFHLKAFQFNWDKLEDIKKYRTGSTIGYDYGAGFSAAQNSNEYVIDSVRSDEINFRKLLKRRINIFPMDVEAGYTLLNQHFPNERQMITHHKKSLYVTSDNLICTNKRSYGKKIVNIFNNGLKKIRERGIYDKYRGDSRKGKYLK